MHYTLENEYISRTIRVHAGQLHTSEIINKRTGETLKLTDDLEFQLRISKGTHLDSTDVLLTSSDFELQKVIHQSDTSMTFLLNNPEQQLQIHLFYELGSNDIFTRKYLKIYPKKDITLERIDLEVIHDPDIYQPYQLKQITAQGPARWKPGLGQPLYTHTSALFMGVEFPAAYNYVSDSTGYCGYQWGRKVKAGESYATYPAVIGVADSPSYLQDAFFTYIDKIRIRPLRLQIQYNSWFDFGNRVDKESFMQSVSKIHQELVVERQLPPLNAYVIDDGWQDVEADWSEKTWRVNHKFDQDFASSMASVEAASSSLGLWLSPGCLFGAQPAAHKYKAQGFEVIGNWMSMAGPRYMQLLEDRMLELTKEGITYFKLDGLFGHLNVREFELNGQNYGIPSMPQLQTEGLSPSDSLLNDQKFDELKTYYLVAGTERLMRIFEKQHAINPEVYIIISNGAYLSPWWLMYVDGVWMINAGDAATGSNRTQELVYRDAIYHDIWQKENTQYPMHAIFNHEPKKIRTGESQKSFAEYLWMNLSRGTGFIELYIKTQVLSEKDWDTLAEGLKWAHTAFPYFKYVRMHGGDPQKSEVYGFTGWTASGGYVSFHNPDSKRKKYSITLNRNLGLKPGNHSYSISSALYNGLEMNEKKVAFGETIDVLLNPGEVKVLNFDVIQ